MNSLASSFTVRTGLLSAITASVFIFLGLSQAGAQDRVLTVASFGGAYTRSQIIAYIDPFRDKTKQWVEVVDYNGGLDEVRDQVLSLNVKWDVVDMTAADAIQACNEGLLERLDGLSLAPSPRGVPAAEDFIDGSLLPCAVGQNIWATVIAYDTSAYEGFTAPTQLSDFFDLQRFPGSRGLQKTARVNLEWALLADGVAAGSIYSLLETDEGLERAFAVLERIRPAIVWWTSGEEPLNLLQRRRVAMAAAWNGRVFSRNRGRNGSIGTIWSGNIWEREYWVIPKGSPNIQAGRALIAFASDPARQAAQSNQIAYSPVRLSAAELVATDVRPFLPTAPDNAGRGIASNADWWARNGERLEDAFLEWADGKRKRSFNNRRH
jgi:putative spermidine/putrescine transport system substrate-binding protein